MFANRDVKPSKPRSMQLTIVFANGGFDFQNDAGETIASLREIKGRWHAVCLDIPLERTEHTYKAQDIWYGVKFIRDHFNASIRSREDVYHKMRDISSDEYEVKRVMPTSGWIQ